MKEWLNFERDENYFEEYWIRESMNLNEWITLKDRMNEWSLTMKEIWELFWKRLNEL